ncbi:MAG: phosphotransferase [Acidimicrobiales bacterium]
MAGAGVLAAPEAVALLSRTTGGRYELVGRLAGGESGAHHVLGPDGAPLVVKWDAEPSSRALRIEALDLTERLRTAGGWPVPRQWTVDAGEYLFVVQELMPGTPVEVLSHSVVDRILELHTARVGLARPDDPVHWPSALLTTLTTGGAGYCRHESLRGYDSRTAMLVTGIEEFGRSISGEDLPGGDIVHWDLHPGNLLADGEDLAAIVDTDFAVVGDATFDLVMLAMASLATPCDPGVRTRLFGAAFDELDELRRRAYLAHLFLRLLDWPIRRGRGDEIEFWLSRAEAMLAL